MTSHEMPEAKRYVPALRFASLTRLYDPLVRLTTRERTFKRRLLAQARIEPGHDVLDLGCGTGTLAVWLKQQQPSARVTGLDGDPTVLETARRKAEGAAVALRLDRGFSYDLPYEDGRFDRVLSSLFFHHLHPRDKRQTLREVVRVLRPAGELHVADWGRAGGPLMRVLFLSVQLLDGFANTRQHVEGELPDLFAEVGLERVALREEMPTVHGTLALYSARRPA